MKVTLVLLFFFPRERNCCGMQSDDGLLADKRRPAVLTSEAASAHMKLTQRPGISPQKICKPVPSFCGKASAKADCMF